MSKTIFQNIDKKLKADIRKGFQQKNINASGNASRSLRSEITEKSYILFGADYIEAAEKGRGKNRSSTGGLFNGVYNWLQYKKYGITYRDDKERRGIAFAIMKKIAKEGSYKFRNPAKQTNVIEQAIESINKDIVKEFIIFTKETELQKLRKVLK